MASYTMNKQDEEALAAAGAAWNAAKTDAERTKAHNDAEAIRAKYGYSGGADGSQQIALNTTSNYTPAGAGSGYYSQYAGMSAADQATLSSYGDAYNTAIAAGDRNAANAAHQAAEALRANYGYSGGTDGSEYIKLAQEQVQTPVASGGGFSYSAAPTYSDNYSARIDAMLNEILNRDAFSYNAAEDDLYQQYAKQYQREGQRAMQDTLGQAAARTGGMASSYATSAAAQANNYYASQLADKIPELYQLAYQMYLDDIDLKVQDLGLLNDASNTQYNRYRDTMSDWRDDRNFAYNMYRDDIGDQQWQQSFDYNASRDQVADDQWAANFGYNAYRDSVADDQWNKTFDYNAERDQVADEQWDKTFEYNAGRDQVADQQWQQAFDRDVYESDRDYNRSVYEDDRNYNYNVSQDTTYEESEEPAEAPEEEVGDDYTVTNRNAESWVYVLGFGRMTWQELEAKVNAGEIIETVDKKGKTITYQKK